MVLLCEFACPDSSDVVWGRPMYCIENFAIILGMVMDIAAVRAQGDRREVKLDISRG